MPWPAIRMRAAHSIDGAPELRTRTELGPAGAGPGAYDGGVACGREGVGLDAVAQSSCNFSSPLPRVGSTAL